MKFWWFTEMIVDSVRSLWRHKLRSTLTLLGVVIGVGAVITVMAMGEGARRSVLREIEGMGLGNIIVESVKPSEVRRSTGSAGAMLRYGLTERDLDQIRAALPAAAVTVAHALNQKVFNGSERLEMTALGVSADYFTFFRTEPLAGKLLADINNTQGHRVAVLSESAAKKVTCVGGAVGHMIHIGPHAFEVIGVVRIPTHRNVPMAFVPYHTARQLYGTITVRQEAGSFEMSQNQVGQAVIQVQDEAKVPAASQVVERTVKRNHGTAGDVLMTVPLDMLKSKQKTQRILNLVLLLIAAISLVVGGIGIMNIMLAIVTERVPEIGIRRALGASQKDITRQFLMETVVLSTLGGLLGCGLGFLLVPLLSHWTEWNGVITPPAVVLSLGVSWVVGVVFGIAPALRAARLNPVACLKRE